MLCFADSGSAEERKEKAGASLPEALRTPLSRPLECDRYRTHWQRLTRYSAGCEATLLICRLWYECYSSLGRAPQDAARAPRKAERVYQCFAGSDTRASGWECQAMARFRASHGTGHKKAGSSQCDEPVPELPR